MKTIFCSFDPAHTKLNENTKYEQVSGADGCCLQKDSRSICIKVSKHMLDLSQ